MDLDEFERLVTEARAEGDPDGEVNYNLDLWLDSNVLALLGYVRQLEARADAMAGVVSAARLWRGTWAVRLEDMDHDDEALCRSIDAITALDAMRGEGDLK